MPDMPMPQNPAAEAEIDAAEVERRLKVPAIEEAEASGPTIPHEVVRADMLADIQRAPRRVAEPL